MDVIFQTFGQAVAFGGGGIALGFAMFKWLSQKWLEDRFARQLATLQHEQDKVIATMRVAIEATLSGVLKIQEREFSVLPQLWTLILQSYAATRAYTYPIEVLPNVKVMDEQALEELLGEGDWSESAKRAVRQAEPSKREEVYTRIRGQYKVLLVRKDWFKANLYVKEQAILLPQELTQRFEALQELLWELIGKREIGVETNDFQMQHAAYTGFEKQVEPMIKSIETAIRDRLESHKVGQLGK